MKKSGNILQPNIKVLKMLGMGGYILTLLSPKKYQNVQS